VTGVWLTVLIIASLGCFAILALGSRLCWRAWREPEGREELGIRLLTGALVAVAILGLQVFFDQRLSSIEDRRRADDQARNQRIDEEAARQNLRLTIGIQKNLTNIDLRGRDLASLYLGGKNLAHAQLGMTNLRNAVLAWADLTDAELQGAHLEGAHLDNAHLADARLPKAHLQNAVLSRAKLFDTDFSYADLRGADLETALNRGSSFSGARYDARTKWPRGMSVPSCPETKSCWLS
jgi:uncharacterized protein YjbI with pentapeptide repeats